MAFSRRQWMLLGPLALLSVPYMARAIMVATDHRTISTLEVERSAHRTIAIFGASGTAGDGILEAALADPDIGRIHVVTRRATPRIDQGVASGKVQMILHTDYTDYTAVRDRLADTDAVFWALGTSSLGVDEETYARIHVEFPLRFVEAWVEVSTRPGKTFHYLSSSDISEDSRSMWARQKVRAEKSLMTFAGDHALKVIAYRPDYIGPTRDEAHVGQHLLFWLFRPVGAAVRATEIGRAMIEVAARGADFENGDKLGTAGIIRYGDAYERRQRRRS
jgi:nucleoside-diphosphate-sugar epimerase